MKNYLVIVAIVFGSIGAANAQALTPRQILFSDKMLESAKADIRKMDINELMMFADSLANCTTSLISKLNEIGAYKCEVSRERYSIQYRRKRFLDKLLITIYLHDMIIHLDTKNEKEADTDIINRTYQVTSVLKDEANLTFQIRRLDRIHHLEE